MLSLTVSLPNLKLCKAHFTYTEKDIDPNMLGLVETINQHPDICTRWCCEGHIRTDHEGNEHVGSTDIQFIVTEEGKKIIEQFYTLIIANNIHLGKFRETYYPKIYHWTSLPVGDFYRNLEPTSMLLMDLDNGMATPFPLMGIDFGLIIDKETLDIYSEIFKETFL